MKSILKKATAVISAAAVSLSAGIFSAKALPTVTYRVSSDSDNLVNIMQSYCFIALDELDLSGHQHGSALARRMAQDPVTVVGSELCLRNDYFATETYIGDFESLVGAVKIGYAKDSLYVGENFNVETGAENFIVNKTTGERHKVESAGTISADTATEKYIDMDNLANSFFAYNRQLAGMADTGNITLSGQDNGVGNPITNITDYNVTAMSGTECRTLTADELGRLSQDVTVNFPSGSTSILVLNIDMNGVSEWNRKPFSLKIGGVMPESGEAVVNSTNVNRVYYNFFDSSTSDAQFTGTVSLTAIGWGTIIAPSAVITSSSNFCGVYIGDTIRTGGETHFTGAYNPVTPIPVTPPSVTLSDISLIKTIDGAANADASTAVFGLYSDSACAGTPIATASPSLNGSDYIVTFDSAGLALSVGNTYYIKEITAANGCEISNDIFGCEIQSDGTVKYNKNGGAFGTPDVFPTCDNATIPTPVTHKTHIEFNKIDSSNRIALEGAKFGIYDDISCAGAPLFSAVSDSNGIVHFSEIEAGTYYLKEIAPPKGYKQNSTIYTATVTFDAIGNGTVTFDGGKTTLTVPNDPVQATASSTSPSATTTTTTTASSVSSSDNTTVSTTTTPSASTGKTPPVISNTTASSVTTPPTGTGSRGTTPTQPVTSKTTASSAGSETNDNDKTSATTLKPTSKTTSDATTAPDETAPISSKTSKTDTTKPPVDSADVPDNSTPDSEHDTPDGGSTPDDEHDTPDGGSTPDGENDTPDSGNSPDSENDTPDTTWSIDSNIVSSPDNSNISDVSSENENPYTGVECAAGAAIIFGELAVAAAILKKKK